MLKPVEFLGLLRDSEFTEFGHVSDLSGNPVVF
jgi:hypothetical protein